MRQLLQLSAVQEDAVALGALVDFYRAQVTHTHGNITYRATQLPTGMVRWMFVLAAPGPGDSLRGIVCGPRVWRRLAWITMLLHRVAVGSGPRTPGAVDVSALRSGSTHAEPPNDIFPPRKHRRCLPQRMGPVS